MNSALFLKLLIDKKLSFANKDDTLFCYSLTQNDPYIVTLFTCHPFLLVTLRRSRRVSSFFIIMRGQFPRRRPEQRQGTHSDCRKKEEILRAYALRNDNIRRGFLNLLKIH